MNDMLIGAITVTSMVVGLYFLRFWLSTRDRFFLFFAASFFLQAVNRILMATMHGLSEDSPAYYLVRLIAYSLIVIAIFDKNRPRRKS